jgi:hypothetical protein
MDRTLSPLVKKRLTTLSTSTTYEPYTPWMPAVGVDAVRALLVARAMIGQFDWRFAMQTAAVDPGRPGTWAPLGDAKTTAVAYCTGNVPIAADVDDKMWVRFGVQYDRGSTPAYAQADMDVQTSLVQRGSIVGRMPTTTAIALSTTVYQPVWKSQWIPAHWVDKVRAGISLAGGTPGVTRFVQLVYQTALVDPSSPSIWTALASGTTYSSNGDHNTGELGPDASRLFSSAMWVRFGIQYKSNQVGDDATIAAVVGVRRT